MKMTIAYAPLLLIENGSMAHDQTNMEMIVSCVDCPLCWLENVHESNKHKTATITISATVSGNNISFINFNIHLNTICLPIYEKKANHLFV